MNTIRILLITFGGSPTEYYYIYGLCNGLKDDEVSILIADYMDKKYVGMLQLMDNVDNLLKISIPKSLPRFFLKLINPFFYINFFKSIKVAYDFDVVHFLFEFRVPFIFVKYINKKYPTIITIHEPRSTIDTWFRKLVLNRMHIINTKQLARLATRVIVLGNKHKDILISDDINKSKIKVIRHGQFNYWKNSFKKENTNNKSSYILFFGNIKPYKGIDVLISSAKILHERLPSLSVKIAGDGDFTRFYPLLKGADYIQVENRFIPDDEIEELFSCASIIVLPYTDGSQSGIISMAASFKKPIVATDVGNFSELIIDGETGLLIPPGDSIALAIAIEKLLVNDKLRHEMGKNAYNYMNENFSWNKIANQTRQVYKEAISEWIMKNYINRNTDDTQS